MRKKSSPPTFEFQILLARFWSVPVLKYPSTTLIVCVIMFFCVQILVAPGTYVMLKRNGYFGEFFDVGAGESSYFFYRRT